MATKFQALKFVTADFVYGWRSIRQMGSRLESLNIKNLMEMEREKQMIRDSREKIH